ncbi:30S ribosome-binding factor RbfA [Rubinisphaera italica]|uniref:Ribosome-binding factor A n=1 Tax=Rubinisphaera italica TaxID=2527969 RepID=A0A5C5XDL6_9PLAN|nr:30S ribosome-binding factor RbfA [Rubinisphaera italica]TWT60215.1 Ribosome-binding factor A [Rubinisphaera italica]HBN76568.1 30S ribosome-binding factor RbfA [Planctomycetaceae bacterium]|tara:strand:- start:223 stop:669 length:447 start_codon:yes stop_codon:yes gene_type:complete
MSTRRTAKASRAVREVLSSAILFELNDPRIKNVTVLSVDVAQDMRSAKVYVSVLGDKKTQTRCIHGLESARGFLQKKVADRIDTRYTPILNFVLDDGVKKSIEASRILEELARERGELEGNEEVEDEFHEPDESTEDLSDLDDSELTN